MTGGNARRLGAAALMLGFLVALPGQAGADDPLPTLSVNDVSAAEGDTVPVVVTLSAVAEADVTVTATTSGGSGYTGRDGTVTIPAGQTTAAFGIETQENDLDQPDRQFTVTLSNTSNNAEIGDATGTGTITDDDATPTLAITGPTTIGEAGSAAYSVAMTGKSAATVSVNLATTNNGTTTNADYGPPRGGTLTWASGDTDPKSLVIPIVDDTLDEFDDGFTVNLSSPSGATIATGAATTAIIDNDAAPSVTAVVDAEVTEADTTANILVRISAPSGKIITINYGPGEGGTATAGADYVAPNGTLTIPAGTEDLEHEIPVTIKQDTIFEGDETLFVNLLGHSNVGTGTDVQGKVTIKPDDDAAAAPTIPAKSGPEGNTGLTDLVFQVTLAGPRPQTTFTYRTIPGTASVADFQSVGGAPLVFPAKADAGPTTLPVTIKVVGDTVDENDETFRLELVNPTTGVVVADAIGTITNDDNNSTLSISDATADEPGTMKFTVTLAPASARAVSVNWATANGTATAGADYTSAGGTLDFAPGETSKTIDVAVLGDQTTEDNETLKVMLSGATGIPGGNLVDGQGDGTIVDKNAPPSLSISDTITREGEGATFTVTLAGTTLRTVTVGFSTGDGTAKAGSDYAARTGSLSFAAGEKSKTIAVTVLDDTAAEPLEDFSVTIGDAMNATITKSRGAASIEANDQATVQGPTPRTTPPTTQPKAQLVPRMILGPRIVSVGPSGLARMLVTCQKLSPIGCAGRVELERAVKPLLKLGQKTFTVKKGAKGYASIKLTVRGLKLLRKNGTLRAKVVVFVKTSTKTLKVSPGVITLKSVKATPKPKPKEPTTKVIVDP